MFEKVYIITDILLHYENHRRPAHTRKILKRDFKSVSGDVSLLGNAGLLHIERRKDGMRKRSKPVAKPGRIRIEFRI